MGNVLKDLFTIGVEEEFFLAHRRTANIVSKMPASFIKDCQRLSGSLVAHELLQSQVETITPICVGADELELSVRHLRKSISQIAMQHGMAIVASGTFPLAEWRDQLHTEKPRYQQLVEDFQIIGRRNLLCGLHVHVEIPKAQDRIDVMNRVMPWLPLFLALSTSSPLWNRQNTGLLSYRQAAYDEWPRTGIPDFFNDEPDYENFVSALVQSRIIPNASQLWWAIRPSSRYPTLELRIADACTHVEDSLCIASIYRCLIRAIIRLPEWGRARTNLTRLLIDENRWQAKRHGIAAEFVDVQRGSERRPLQAYWQELLSVIAEDAVVLNCEAQVMHAEMIFTRGSSAAQQLNIYRAARIGGASRHEACRETVRWLMNETIH
jgi:glutamate---cysteine ligase / carboxylate-amine ligase